MTRQELTALSLATLKEMAANLTVTGDKRRKETWVNALIAAEIYEQETVQTPEPSYIEQPATESPAPELLTTAPTATSQPAAELPATSNASIIAVAIIAILVVSCQLLAATIKLLVIAVFKAYNLAVKVKQSIPAPKSAQSIDYFPEPA